MKKAKRVEIVYGDSVLIGCKFDIVRCEGRDIVVNIGGVEKEIDMMLCHIYYEEELTYAERQAEWVRENGLKVGDKVKVVKEWDTDEFGIHMGLLHKHMDEIFEICIIGSNAIRLKDGDALPWTVPYFALEPAKDEYRAFKNAEEFKPYRDKWYRVKDGGGMEKATYYDDDGIKDGECVFVSYDDCLKLGEWEDGSPIGVKL